MSAWVCSDKHIASVVCACYSDEAVRQRVADTLKRENIRSVNYRYNERSKFTPCDLKEAEPLGWKDVAMLAHSIDYQSCERPDYKKSKAYREFLEVAAHAAYKLADGGKWSL